jgi:quinol-cytochrome oxidoreductase complex cytochrome b subunit
MIGLAVITHVFMDESVEGTDIDGDKNDVQNTESTISIPSLEEENKEKIELWRLFTYKLFVFGACSAFFNLILYTLLEPILSDRLSELGVEESKLGQYF